MTLSYYVFLVGLVQPVRGLRPRAVGWWEVGFVSQVNLELSGECVCLTGLVTDLKG
jgi:hypothetical protein